MERLDVARHRGQHRPARRQISSGLQRVWSQKWLVRIPLSFYRKERRVVGSLEGVEMGWWWFGLGVACC